MLLKYFQEQPKKDEKVEEQKPGEKTDSPAPPPPSFVLYTDLHCVGCAKKIEKVLIKMKGTLDAYNARKIVKLQKMTLAFGY